VHVGLVEDLQQRVRQVAFGVDVDAATRPIGWRGTGFPGVSGAEVRGEFGMDGGSVESSVELSGGVENGVADAFGRESLSGKEGVGFGVVGCRGFSAGLLVGV